MIKIKRPDRRKNDFPSSFILGTAASDYQTAGYKNGIKGKNKWMHWEETFKPGFDGSMAVNYYNKYAEDHKMMSDFGVQSFRFEISFTRLFPDPHSSRPSKESIEYYHNIIDNLISNNIEPFANLYHFDSHWEYYEKGEWASKEMLNQFNKFIDLCVKEYGSKVKKWAVANEPGGIIIRHLIEMNYSWELYKDETRELEYNWPKFTQAVHHMNLAHARLYMRVHENNKKTGNNGVVGTILQVHPFFFMPSSTKKEDWIAIEKFAAIHEEVFVTAQIEGEYSKQVLDIFEEELGHPFAISDEDKKAIMNAKADFIGFNVYQDFAFMEAKKPGEKPRKNTLLPFVNQAKDPEGLKYYWRTSDYGGNKAHGGVESFFRWAQKRFGNHRPFYITEVGIAGFDEKIGENPINDNDRVQYIESIMTSIIRCINIGINIQGLWIWSFMDNLEWDLGYKLRFGMVHVDFKTFVRTPKKSMFYFKELSKTRTIPEYEVTPTKYINSAVNW